MNALGQPGRRVPELERVAKNNKELHKIKSLTTAG
jgi:hypothetical protein